MRSLAGDAAEDVAQEAFLVALEQWEHVAALAAPGAWVRLVARRIGWRRRSREVRRAELEARDPPSTSISDLDVPDIDLARAMARLPARHRLAVALHHLQDLSVADVAQALGSTEEATRVLLFRARERLGTELSGHFGTWISSTRWETDDVARALGRIATRSDTEIVVEDLNPRGARWMLSLGNGRYRLATDDGERLDWGAYRSRRGTLELTPWNESGLIRLAMRINGRTARFEVLSDTSSATKGVADEVFMRLLLETAAFVPAPDGM